MKKPALLFILAAIATHAQNYPTNFPATENPISQGGKWISGGAAGNNSGGGCPPAGDGNQCWKDVQTTPGLSFGQLNDPACGGIVGNDCNDSTAVLTGTWSSNQVACGTVFIDPTLNRSNFYEIELRVNTTISLHSITGYEFTYSTKNGGQYAAFARWNGPLGNFTGQPLITNIPVLATGDVICAGRVGGTLTATHNRGGVVTTIGTYTDSTYLGGSPGQGFQNISAAPDSQKFGWSFWEAFNVNALTCNKSDVNSVINGPIHTVADGESVGIPPGTCTWTGAGGVTVPAARGVAIIGYGMPNSGAAVMGANTAQVVLIDSLTSGGMITMNPSFGNSLSRISMMNVKNTLPTTGYSNPIGVFGVCTSGGCPHLRIDNMTVPTTWRGPVGDASFANVANMFGVADHNTVGDVQDGNGVDFINVAHGSWKGVGNWGDNSWASPFTFGTVQAFYLENNILNYAFGTDTDIGGSAGGGARLVCRFNTFNFITPAGVCSGHGTDTTGRARGVLQWEGYDNTGTCPFNNSQGCGSAWPARSGTGVSFGNTFTNVTAEGGNGFFKTLTVFDDQRTWRQDFPWGSCDGTSPWDTNDGVVYFSGTIGTFLENGSGSGNWVLTDSGSPGWTTNQWVNPGSLYAFHDVTQNNGIGIASNNSNSLSLVNICDNCISFRGKPGDAYQILRATACMDQGTRGNGQLITGPANGTNPVLASTGMPGPVAQAIEPTYQADDSLPQATATATIASRTLNITANRDFFAESINQGQQTSSTSPFNGTSGSGHGTLALRPTTCTPQVGYLATDQGSWNTSGVKGPHGYLNGEFFICTALNTWTLSIVPFTYPHPDVTGPTSGGSPAVSFSPSSISFGNVLVGSTSPTTAVSLNNTGSGPLTVNGITITGTNPADFAQTNNCGTGVSVGGSCTISVTCTPLSAASFSASVSVSDNAAGSPQTVPLTCTGITALPAIGFSPTTVSFAARTVGTSSSPTAVTVTNTGTATLTITSVGIVGGNSTSFSQTNNCGSVAPAGTCTINVTFTPQVAGSLSSNVSVVDNAAGSPQVVPLNGVGNGVPGVSFNPTSLLFGNQTVSVTSSALSTTVTNTGTASLTLSSVTLTGTNAADFAISANTCGGSLAINATCSVSITFTPGSTGTRSANLTFTDNAAASPQNVPLSGTGTQAGASFNPASISFGNQNLNTTSAPITITLTNSGSATLNISSITIAGTNAPDFAISSKTCGTTLSVSASCTVSVTFTPSVLNTNESANLLFTDNAPGSPQAVPMGGVGVGTFINIAPSSLSFASTVVGQSTAAQIVTVSNVGGVAISFTSIVVSGGNSGDFRLGANTCGSSLAVSQSCNVSVVFQPTSAGARSSAVVFTDSAPNSPQSVTLSGTGTQSGAQVSPTLLSFGNQAVGTTSGAQAVTLTNNGTAVLNISSIALRPGDTYFAIGANTCGSTLAVNASCTVSETFTPGTAGNFTSLLSFTDDGPASPQTVAGSGVGTTTALNFNPASLTFPNTALSTTSSPLTVTVQNTGNGTVTFSSITIAGTNASNFAQTNNCGASLGGGASCTVSVTFTPSANGSRTASLTFTDSAPGSPQTVSLQGTGFTPAPSVSLSVSSVTFGNQTTGTASNPQVVILTNSGTASLTISSTSITGTNAGDFGSSTTCSGNLAVNASCTYSFVFTPTAAGSRTATFNLVTNAASSPDHVSLSGTGVMSPGGAPAPQVFGDD